MMLSTDPTDFAGFFSRDDFRPSQLAVVDPLSLHPLERIALTLDGTLTTFLIMLAGEPIRSEVIDDAATASADDLASFHKMMDTADDTITENALRRIVLRGTSGIAYIAARSLLRQDFAPSGFAAALKQAPRGLGQALNNLNAEHYRELLWCGRGPGRNAEDPGILVRAYRMRHAGRAFAVVEEAFLVPLGSLNKR